MLAACGEGVTVVADASVADAFVAPYEGFIAVGETFAKGRITGTGGCKCPWEPPSQGECVILTDNLDWCSSHCPQCVDNIIVHAPGKPPVTWPWAGFGEGFGMQFFARYEAASGERLRVEVEGCHGTIAIERPIPTRPRVIVGASDLGGDVVNVTWETNGKADEVEITVNLGGADVCCLTEDSGSFAVSLPSPEIRSVSVERRFRVGEHQTEDSNIVYFESSHGQWKPTVDGEPR